MGKKEPGIPGKLSDPSWIKHTFFCNLNIKTRKRKHKSNKLHKERKSTHQGEKYIFL
jgi:hypothetical protein